jgi:hypothetical protein
MKARYQRGGFIGPRRYISCDDNTVTVGNTEIEKAWLWKTVSSRVGYNSQGEYLGDFELFPIFV